MNECPRPGSIVVVVRVRDSNRERNGGRDEDKFRHAELACESVVHQCELDR